MAQKAAASKIDKNELKRLMREEKAKRIESPLAKYNSIGQLTCVVCNQIIKSELYWSAHLTSKAHLQQIEALKSSTKQQKTTDDGSASFKRPHPMSQNENGDMKKARTDSIHVSDTSKKLALLKQAEEESDEVSDNDDEDRNELATKAQKMEISPPPPPATATSKVVESTTTQELPQGFFDDRKKDLKARNIDYDATLDSEFAKFKAELQNEETKNEILADLDDEVRDVDRDLEEVDQLIQKWSRVEDLHQRKENLVKLRNERMNIEQQKIETDKSDDEEEEDIDIDSVINLTLRTKNRC